MLKVQRIPPNGRKAEPESELYRATVNGTDAHCYIARVSAIPFNRRWPGHQRSIDQTEESAFLDFASDGPVELVVRSAVEAKNPIVRPLAKGVEAEPLADGAVRIRLAEPGQYVYEPDGSHGALHIFFDPIGGEDGAKDATYCFGPGVHIAGEIRLGSGESVYIDRDAAVYGSVTAENAENVRVFGAGILDDGMTERVLMGVHTAGNLDFIRCKGVKIEGVILRNSACYVMNTHLTDDILMDGVKAVGHWRYNTDGFDFHNARNVLVQNSFVRSFDDATCCKGDDTMFPEEEVRSSENQTWRNCVLWCGWGRTLEVGLETCGKEVKHLLYEDCYLIHNSAICMDIQNGDYAMVHDVVYRNIHVEMQRDTLPEIMQTSEKATYKPEGPGEPWLICMVNWRYREGGPYVKEGLGKSRSRYPYSEGAASVFDVKYENIRVYADYDYRPFISLRSKVDEVYFHDILIDGIYVNGKRLAKEDMKFDLANVKDLTVR